MLMTNIDGVMTSVGVLFMALLAASGGTLKAPKHLKAATRLWWEHVASMWTLEQHHLRLLTQAGNSWDRCEQARKLLAKDGLTVPTKDGGVRAHPAVRIEAEARISFCRCLRELDLDVEPPASERSRPPALRSVAR
jgi:P27 family predicted phage terminase small subunit